MDKPRILLISYWFPPAPGAAAERMAAFAHYLPESGWEVDVLTAARGEVPAWPGVTIHGVRDPLETSGSFADFDPRRKESLIKRRLRGLIFPDRFLRWRRAAVARGLELLRQRRPDVILASFPPASAVQAALDIHGGSKSNPPGAAPARLWIDYRDRWLGPGGYAPAGDWSARRHAALERRACARAGGLIAVSETMAEALSREQEVDRGMIHVIPNGFEPVAAPPTPQPPLDGPLLIAHVGTVIPRNRPELFFQSLQSARRQGRFPAARFEFIGNLSAEYVRSLGLADLVATTGLLPRSTAHERMRQAHALLLLTGDYVGRWGISAKLFEYLQSGRPVLCLEETPGSNDRRLLERFAPDRSFFAPLGDAAALLSELSKLAACCARLVGTAVVRPPGLEEFDRRAQTRLLARALDQR